MHWFLNYAEKSNGVKLIKTVRPQAILECDSSLVAGGGTSDTHYYQLRYSKAHRAKYTDITQLEATNIVTAYRTLAPNDTPGIDVIIYTDNMGSCHALESGRTHHKVLAACSRQLWLEAALKDHHIEIRHRPGAELELPDALSRPHIASKVVLARKLVKERSLRCLKAQLPHPMFSCI